MTTAARAYRAEMSDFGWAVTWDGEDDVAFRQRQANRFLANLPLHQSAEDALEYWSRRYGRRS